MYEETPQASLTDLQARVSKTVLIASIVLFLAIFVNDLMLGLYLIATFKIGMIGVCVWALHKLRQIGFQERVAHMVFLPLILFMVLNYLTNQGLDGPTILGTMGLFVSYPIILSRTWSHVYTVGTLVLFLGLLYIGMDPEKLIIAEYPADINRVVDHALTYIVMVAYTTIMIGMVLHVYRTQNRQLEQAHKSLETHILCLQAEKQHKEHLLAILAHDVRNPVHNLMQLIELFRENLVNPAEMQHLLHDMNTRVDALKHSVEHILDDIKTKMQQKDEDTVWLHPVTLTQDLLQHLQFKLASKQQKVHFEYPPNLYARLRFGQNAHEVSIVLRNLLDNASKYSSDGATVHVHLQQTDSRLIWDVRDEGIGVADNIREDLFTRTIASRQGSGVGLLLCKSISESIGAELTYLPQPQGSLFRLAVPYEQTDKAPG
jgi:two-component system, sensor histidine kinase and response regulator